MHILVSRTVVRNWELSGRLQLVQQLRHGQLFPPAGWQRPSHQPQFQHEVTTHYTALPILFLGSIWLFPPPPSRFKCWCTNESKLVSRQSTRIRVSSFVYSPYSCRASAQLFGDSPSTHADVRKPSILDQVLTSPNVASLLVAHLLLYLAPTSRVIVHGGGPFGMMTETAGQMFVDVGPSLSDKLKEEAMGRLREDTTQQVHREVFYRRMRVLKIGQQSKVVYSIRPFSFFFLLPTPPRSFAGALLAQQTAGPELYYDNSDDAETWEMGAKR